MEQQYTPPSTKLALESNKRYHVFLSFRGPDVRKTLVDHLYQALFVAGLNVFLDNEKLEKGEVIGESLERAIESSAIRIPIFSRGYAESTWCLREAAAMLSSPGLIIPLFYHVDPTHVRYPQGDDSPYRKSFSNHYRHRDRYSTKEINGWKLALRQICSRSGWSLDLTEGYEGRLVKTVVNDLIKTFNRVPLQVAKHPVGVDNVKNALIHKLNLNSMDGLIKLGIWGIGGIGKTTIAKAIYNEVHTDFDAASFVANVRSTAADDATGLMNLQKQILKDLAKNDVTVNSIDHGISLFRDRLGGKRVLLVLDDVDGKQVDALVGDWLAPGSRVIITTRDKHILNVAQFSSECIHEMSGLEIDEGLQLFCWHAFLKAYPSPSYADLSNRIVEACKGHPLSLEVIGSYLYDKQNDKDCWMEALHNIIRYPEIQERLYISYGALSDEEKEIFLDIACFFIGEEKTCPIVFWKSLKYKMVISAVSNLSMKSLIKIDDKGRFDMHDHLRDMGRSIAENEKVCTRLWEATRLSAPMSINNGNFSRIRLSGGNLQRLEVLYTPGLCYLHLQNVTIKGIAQDTLAMLPTSLIWLELENCDFEMNRVPREQPLSSNIGQLKIMRLQSHDHIYQLFISSVFVLPNIQLQHLNMGGCSGLNNLPDSIGNLSQLQHLDMGHCSGLNNLPDSIGNLSQLQHLDMGSCSGLNNLPDSIGNLSQLQHLDMASCSGLNNLPDSIGNLSQLQHLHMGGCSGLNNLPDSIGNLSQLQHLDMGWCSGLNNLPDSIGNLSQLQHLDMGWCSGLNNLPDSIGNLSQLQHLDMGWCSGLNNLPDSIGNLSHLQHLDMGWCSGLNNLPDSIGNLSQLQHLHMGECSGLNNLPDSIGNLSQLQHLHMRWCSGLNNLPDSIGNLSQLQHLDMGWCSGLNNLPDSIGNLSQLQHLDMGWCSGLNNLPDSIGNLSQLQHLDMGGCSGLNNLPDSIGNLSQLQHLDMGWCSGLNNLPDSIGNLSQLQHLDMGGCSGLNNLPDSIGNLSQLQHLDMRWYSGLNNLPDSIGNLSQLQHLDMRWCSGLNNLPDSIGNLSQLQHLDMRWCSGLNNLPDSIGNLSQLQHLDMGWCSGLNNLPDSIGNLSQLQHLDMGECSGLNNLPDSIGNLSQLQHLDMGACSGLNNLPDSIGNLSQLQHLDMGACSGLNNLPDSIGNLSQLQHLDMGACSGLNNLPDSIGNLSQLQHLDMEGCSGLNNLPDSIGVFRFK
ncbi:hypothetical protein SUGI_0840960 [Cryptomeria japonica]|uniref:disease resistance protein RUN1 isoform X1 n=1 Tax=Cryptomeria japonica TaxID=3369 RepID=UPI00241485CE|nr:disease resistance protein RUN1 isoform X1 [Cryptomeria japonica]GLJ40704.1 hypothetical protein SUGI_0840960 [Cryptomeria japonica]